MGRMEPTAQSLYEKFSHTERSPLASFFTAFAFSFFILDIFQLARLVYAAGATKWYVECCVHNEKLLYVRFICIQHIANTIFNGCVSCTVNGEM